MANDKGARALGAAMLPSGNQKASSTDPNILVKVKLTSQYLWSGEFYGPGEVQVPESFVDAYNLKPTHKLKPPKTSDGDEKLSEKEQASVEE